METVSLENMMSANPDGAVRTGTATPTVRTFDEFAALPPAYVGFLQQIGRGHFFLGYEWFRNLIATALEKDARIRIYGVEAEDGDVRAVLFARTPAGQNGSVLPFPPGVNSLAGLSNFQSPVFGVSVSPGMRDPRVFEALGRQLEQEPPRWGVIDFNYMDSTVPSYGALIEGLRSTSLIVRPYFHCREWYEDTTGLNYRGYLTSRPSSAHKIIQNYARKARKLERSARVRYEIYQSADLDRALLDYQKVYASSWKEAEPFPRFVPGLLRTAADLGVLRLGILYVDDEPADTEVAIVAGGRAAMVKTAYDQKFRDVSAGSIIISRVMEHLLEVDRVSEISFGPFDAPYKSVWVSRTRELRGMVAFNPRTASGLRGFWRQLVADGRRTARRAASRLLKRS